MLLGILCETVLVETQLQQGDVKIFACTGIFINAVVLCSIALLAHTEYLHVESKFYVFNSVHNLQLDTCE